MGGVRDSLVGRHARRERMGFRRDALFSGIPLRVTRRLTDTLQEVECISGRQPAETRERRNRHAQLFPQISY